MSNENSNLLLLPFSRSWLLHSIQHTHRHCCHAHRCSSASEKHLEEDLPSLGEHEQHACGAFVALNFRCCRGLAEPFGDRDLGGHRRHWCKKVRYSEWTVGCPLWVYALQEWAERVQISVCLLSRWALKSWLTPGLHCAHEPNKQPKAVFVVDLFLGKVANWHLNLW